VTVSNKDNGGYEPPEQTEKIDEFDISVNDSKDVEMNITFRVNKSRISNDKLNNTRLYRRNDGDWQELETKYINSTETKHRFKSKIPGFSPFIVAVKNQTKSYTIENKDLQDRSDVPVRPVEEPENKLLKPINVPYFVLAILIPLLTYIFIKKRSSEEEHVDTEVDKYKEKMRKSSM